nr:14317_t:CDS:1 [Entrophospora candida]
MKKSSLLTTLVLFFFITIASSSGIFIEDEIEPFDEVEYWWSLSTQVEQEVLGSAYFTQTAPPICKSVMYFDRGFASKDPNDYGFTVGYFNMSKHLRDEIPINTPGTSPFSLDFTEFSCRQIVGKKFIIKCRDDTIGDYRIRKL